MARGQADALIPMLEQILHDGSVAWGDLTALAVGIGPGNFTGIRIAVAAARGLALALKIPAIGVSVFEARAFGHTRPLTVVEDARRGEVYVQDFTPDPAPPCLLDPTDAQGFPPMPITGSAAENWAQQTGGTVLPARCPLAEAIARAAAYRLDQPQPRPAPLYIRPADAAPPSEQPPLLLP